MAAEDIKVVAAAAEAAATTTTTITTTSTIGRKEAVTKIAVVTKAMTKDPFKVKVDGDPFSSGRGK